MPKQILPDVKARDGDHFLILCPGYWGKGETLTEAEKNLPYSLDPKRWVVHSVHPSTSMNEDGQFTRTAGTPAPLELARAR